MVKPLITALLLLSAVLSYGDPQTTEYVVWRDSFPKLTIDQLEAMGKKTIQDAGGQPYGITHWLIYPNTNFMSLWVSTNTNTESLFLKTAETGGGILKHATGGIVTDGKRKVWKKKIYSEYPRGIYCPWSEKISTRTAVKEVP